MDHDRRGRLRRSGTSVSPRARTPPSTRRTSSRIRTGSGGRAWSCARAHAGSAGFTRRVKERIWTVDSAIPITQLRTVSDVVAGSLAEQRFTLTLIALFSGVALVLSALGIYGVTSYVAAQRTREIGLRLALGAAQRDVFALVLLRGARLVSLGVAIGLVGAFLLTRFIRSLVYQVRHARSAHVRRRGHRARGGGAGIVHDPGLARGAGGSAHGVAAGVSARIVSLELVIRGAVPPGRARGWANSSRGLASPVAALLAARRLRLATLRTSLSSAARARSPTRLFAHPRARHGATAHESHVSPCAHVGPMASRSHT